MNKKSLVTVTLNPCVDTTVSVEKLIPGELNRIIRKREDLSGKGINVAAAYAALGEPVISTGWLFASDREAYLKFFFGFGIEDASVIVDGSTRRNMKIRDLTVNVVTEVNESGFIPEGAVDALKTKLAELMPRAGALSLSGSVPKGVPDDIYYQLMSGLDNRPFTILDTEKDWLLYGLKARPDMIKPNIRELNDIAGRELNSRNEIVQAAREVAGKFGINTVGVTLGEEGAIMVTGAHSWFSPPLNVDVKSATGAGDSFVAGVLKAVAEALPEDEWLRYGMAASGDSVSREGTLLTTEDGFREMLKQVKIEAID